MTNGTGEMTGVRGSSGCGGDGRRDWVGGVGGWLGTWPIPVAEGIFVTGIGAVGPIVLPAGGVATGKKGGVPVPGPVVVPMGVVVPDPGVTVTLYTLLGADSVGVTPTE